VEYALASRVDRFWASLIDWWIFVSPVVLVDGGSALTRSVACVVWLGALAYQFALAQRGQSIGKQLRGLRVVRTDGTAVSLPRIVFVRNALAVIAPVDALFIFRRDERCLHDLLADTKVVNVGRKAR
jgi:uncharacterized RDD family membrane protein YckC